MKQSNPLRDTIVGVVVAGFAAFFWVLYQPPNRRPTPTEVVGRVGVGMLAGLLVGAVVTDYFNVSQSLAYGICGAAGIFGERVFAAAAGWAKLKYGVDLTESPKPEPPKKEEKNA